MNQAEVIRLEIERHSSLQIGELATERKLPGQGDSEKEKFWLQVGPNSWQAGGPLTHHAAALRCKSVPMRR